MRLLWWRKPKAEVNWEDQRTPIRWCDGCRTPRGPFSYFQNGKHYCAACADKMQKTMRLKQIGKRRDDVHFP
jgi:hypothetical protein